GSSELAGPMWRVPGTIRHRKRRAAQTPDVTGDRPAFRPCSPPRRRRTPLALAQLQSEKEVEGGSRQTTFLFVFSAGGTGPDACTLPGTWRGLNDDPRKCRPDPERNARGGAAAGCLRRVAPPGGGVDRPPAPGPDPPTHRPGPRGLSETGARPRPRLGEP